MGKIKIHEIAKKMGLTSKEVLEKAQKLNIDVKSHLSAVTDEEAKKIEDELTKSNKTDQKSKNVAKQSSANKKDEPVIIRREVIISDEEMAKKEEAEKKKRQSEREKQLGFVERNKSKDFNIVYRNKQTKPLTVEELFGLKKKEEPKQEKKEPKKEEKVEAKPSETKEETSGVKPEQKIENKKIEKSERENMIGVQNNKTTKQTESNNKREEKDFSKRNNNFNNRRDNKNFRNNNNRDGYRNNNYRNNNNNYRNNNFNRGSRPMDERTIEKNIKNIMSSEVAEKENVREYNKSVEKQKIIDMMKIEIENHLDLTRDLRMKI